MNEYPDYIHWFSRLNRISLELPFRFEEDGEDVENRCVTYREASDEREGPGTVIMTKMTGVPVDSTGAYLTLAKESAQIPGDATATRREIIVDGVPAIDQEQEYRDDRTEITVLRRELFAQIGNLVFSITALVPRDRADDLRPALDHAFRSARFILLPAANQYAGSYAHEDTQISIVVPENWEAQEVEKQHIRFFGPPHPDHNDYRPTFSVSLGKPGGFGDAWLEGFLEETRGNIVSSYREFSMIAVDRFPLSSLVEAHVMSYRWEPEPGLAFTQIQALILVDMFRMYLINGATLEPLADAWMPVFDEMLKSLRVLGPVA
jgi:hypothetical protein